MADSNEAWNLGMGGAFSASEDCLVGLPPLGEPRPTGRLRRDEPLRWR
jgi:hypothetical protein